MIFLLVLFLFQKQTKIDILKNVSAVFAHEKRLSFVQYEKNTETFTKKEKKKKRKWCGTAWEWVNDGNIFGRTIPLNRLNVLDVYFHS